MFCLPPVLDLGMNLGLFGPVRHPVVRPQTTHPDARLCLYGLADIGGYTALAPVGNRLRRSAEKFSEGTNPTRFEDCFVKSICDHAAMINAPFTTCQHPVVLPFHTPFMAETKDEAWLRVAAELRRRGLGLSWLAEQMSTSVQRVQNWTTRGLPPKAYGAVAAVLDESIDWIAGLADPRWKEQSLPLTSRERLSEDAVRVGILFDTLPLEERGRIERIIKAAIAVDIDLTERPIDMGGIETNFGELKPTRYQG